MLNWCPFAKHVSSPNVSLRTATISAVVLHIMDGGFDASVQWLCNPASGVSAHFGIAKDGRLVQMVALDTAAHTNGLSYQQGRWYNSQGKQVIPRWSGVIPGVNPNNQTITIECEGRSGEPMTNAMLATLVKLLQWLKEQTGMIYQSGQTLIRHSDIDPIGKSYCPGSAFDLSAIATAANADPDLALWGDAAPYNKTWRIPTAWRQHKQQLGKALDKPIDAQGATWQRFQGGIIEFVNATQTIRVYLAV